MAGIFHAYYTVALAPAVAALVGIGAWVLWRERHDVGARVVLAGTVAATAVWAFVLLDRTADYLPWLRYAVLAVGLVSAALLVGVSWFRAAWPPSSRPPPWSARSPPPRRTR